MSDLELEISSSSTGEVLGAVARTQGTLSGGSSSSDSRRRVQVLRPRSGSLSTKDRLRGRQMLPDHDSVEVARDEPQSSTAMQVDLDARSLHLTRNETSIFHDARQTHTCNQDVQVGADPELLLRAASEAVDAHRSAAEAKASQAVSSVQNEAQLMVGRLQNELEMAKHREKNMRDEIDTLRTNLLTVSQQTPSSKAGEHTGTDVWSRIETIEKAVDKEFSSLNTRLEAFQFAFEQLSAQVRECQHEITCVRNVVQAWSDEDAAQRQDDWWTEDLVANADQDPALKAQDGKPPPLPKPPTKVSSTEDPVLSGGAQFYRMASGDRDGPPPSPAPRAGRSDAAPSAPPSFHSCRVGDDDLKSRASDEAADLERRTIKIKDLSNPCTPRNSWLIQVMEELSDHDAVEL